MSGLIPNHTCNVLCSGNVHSDVWWTEFGDEWMRSSIIAFWRSHPIGGRCELLDVRRVEGLPPTETQLNARYWVGTPFAYWAECFCWGIQWREPINDAMESEAA